MKRTCTYLTYSAIALCIFLFQAGDALSGKITTITVGSEFDYPPFCIVDDNGNATGFSVELIRAAAGAMNIELTFRTGTWDEVSGLLARGEIDALPLVGRTPEREDIYDFTFPYLSLHGAIVVRDDNTVIHNLSDLQGKRVAVMKNDNAEEFLRREDRDRDRDIYTTETFTEALHELSEGRCDAVVIQRLLALRLIQESGIKNLRVLQQPIEAFEQNFCFAVTENNSELLSVLNEGLAIIIADGTFAEYQRKWFASLEQPLNKRFIIGTELDYPPYSFLNEDGEADGYNVDLTNAIARVMGMDVDIRIGPWGEIREALENGEIDAIAGMYYSEERDRIVDFSTPFIVAQHAIFVRKGVQIDTEKDLLGKEIIVMQGDIMHEHVLKNELTQTPVIVETQADALRLLAMGEHDCALLSRLPGLYWRRELGLENITITGPALAPSEYCFAVQEGDGSLQQMFSDGLIILEDTAELRRIYDKWFDVLDPRGVSLRKVILLITVLVIPVLVILLVVVLWNRTLKKKVAERTRQLSESETLFRTTVETGPSLIFVIDANITNIYVSPNCFDYTGYTQEELLGSQISLVHEDDLPMIHDLHKKSVEMKKGYKHIEYRMVTKDRNVWQASASWEPFFDNQENVKGFVISISNITEQKLLEEQLQIRVRMDSLGTLAGGIAHDFNNLLAGIMGYLGLLKIDTENLLPNQIESIEKSYELCQKSARIIKNFQSFSSGLASELYTFDMRDVADDVFDILSRTTDRIIEKIVEIPRGKYLLWGQSDQIHQVLLNLGINAVHAIEEKGVRPGDYIKVSISSCEPDISAGKEVNDESYMHVVFEDTGIGMSENIKHRAFDPLFTTKKLGNNKGQGLGLTMVYNIITKMHQGKIEIESQIGKGTKFHIYLKKASGKSKQKKADEPEVIDGGTETILIIEDEESVSNIAKKTLTRYGYKVYVASDGESGLNLYMEKADSIDIVILDLTLPKLHGEKVLAEIVAFKPEVNVIISSGHSQASLEHPEYVDAFLMKPYNIKELASVMRTVCDSKFN